MSNTEKKIEKLIVEEAENRFPKGEGSDKYAKERAAYIEGMYKVFNNPEKFLLTVNY